MAGSLFVHCKIAYFYIVSLPNFVTIRRTHFSIYHVKFSAEFARRNLRYTPWNFAILLKDSVSPSVFFCTLLTDRNEHVAAKADSSLSNRRASLSR